MLRQAFLCGLVLLSICATFTHGYSSCITAKKAGVDPAWFNGIAKLHVIQHSDCNNCESSEAWSWLRGSGRTIPQKLCWDIVADTTWGERTLPLTCKYNDLASQECEINFSHSDLSGKVQFGGNMVITKTDNSTYVAGTLCIFGKENLWWVAGTSGDLSASVLNEIRADFFSMGFKEGNTAKAGTSPLYFKQMSVRAC